MKWLGFSQRSLKGGPIVIYNINWLVYNMNSLVGIVSPRKFEGGSYGNTFIDWCTIKTKWLGMSLPRISEGRPIGIHHLVVEQLKQNIGICPLKKFERKVWWWYIHWLELNKNKIIGIISQEVWRGGPVDASFGCWAIRSKILVFAFSQDIWREGLMVIHSLVGAHKNNDWDIGIISQEVWRNFGVYHV